MGVSGSGKTTFGNLLSSKLLYKFFDADDFHTEENKIKMSQGISLSDFDRIPWLIKLNSILLEATVKNNNIILACSALKQNYRSILLDNIIEYKIVFLRGNYNIIQNRLKKRVNHFFPKTQLKNQFENLEEPKEGLTIDVNNLIEENLKTIITYINS